MLDHLRRVAHVDQRAADRLDDGVRRRREQAIDGMGYRFSASGGTSADKGRDNVLHQSSKTPILISFW
jgi:hypothetical protein